MNFHRHLLLFLAIGAFHVLSPSFSLAGDWQEVDLEGVLRHHPLMQSFDRAKPGFRGTPSEVRDPQQLKTEILILDLKLKALAQEKRPLIDGKSLFPGISGSPGASGSSGLFGSSGDNAWKQIRKIDQEREEILKKRNELNTLLQNNGVPARQALLTSIRTILSDLQNPLKIGSRTIVLNTLPRAEPILPAAETSLRDCFLVPSSPRWQQYVNAARFWHAFFPSVHRTILYQKGTSLR